MQVPRFLAIAFLFALSGLTACGTETEVADSPTTTEIATTTSSTTPEVEEDHDDEHEEDHSDEDEDEDEDHDDDDDHSDEDEDHDDHSSGLGAHEHGTAEMTVAWIEGDVAIELISPTFNVFGFEYEPETAEDIALAAQQTEVLTASDTLTINDEADCTLTEPVSTTTDQDGTHSEITASWLFTCANPDEISLVDATGLFAVFPNFEDVDVQWVSASSQSSAELSPRAPSLTLES